MYAQSLHVPSIVYLTSCLSSETVSRKTYLILSIQTTRRLTVSPGRHDLVIDLVIDLFTDSLNIVLFIFQLEQTDHDHKLSKTIIGHSVTGLSPHQSC